MMCGPLRRVLETWLNKSTNQRVPGAHKTSPYQFRGRDQKPLMIQANKSVGLDLQCARPHSRISFWSGSSGIEAFLEASVSNVLEIFLGDAFGRSKQHPGPPESSTNPCG